MQCRANRRAARPRLSRAALKPFLFVSTAIVAISPLTFVIGSATLLSSALIASSPALADGGAGGGPVPGAGGSDSYTGAGGAGGAGGSLRSGGGGGGAGVAGGAGGAVAGPAVGGAGGVSAGANGADGTSGGFGGSGGGGGAHGHVGAGLPGAAVTGGNGGTGGNAVSGDGGGGGAGGYGAIETGGGNLGTLTTNVTGGAGGKGGDGSGGYDGGDGGSGGVGLGLNSATLTIGATATVQGGNGGAGGSGSPAGSNGAGGVGLGGSNLTLTIDGAVLGGLAGDGTTRANAIVFTGGTNALTFGNATTGLTGGIDVTGSLDFNQSSIATTVDSVITGTGAVSKSGTNMITLTGANTYGGGTMINGGTLQLGNGGTTGSIMGDVIDNGTFAINRSDSVTFGGVISGSGAFEQNGTGTTTLTGTNTYSGGTMVNAGTLRAGSGTAFGTGRVTVASGATLDVGTQDLTIGSLAGSGTVTDGGVANPTLTIGSDNTSTTFSGVVQDGANTLSLIKTGTGTLILSGNNTYTGGTTINAGSLAVDGSIASSSGLMVNSGATVGGTGTLPSTVIAGGATLAPGNSVGTIAVTGNLTFNSGARYAVQVSAGTADRTNITGTASLAGTVDASFAMDAYTGRSYTILSADGGLGGSTFDTLTVSNLPSSFEASLSYTDTEALLNLTAMLGGGQSLDPNQQNVADALNNYFNNGGTLPANFVSLFDLTGNDLANALTALSGEVPIGGQRSAFQLMNGFFGLLFNSDSNGGGNAGGTANAFAAERSATFPAAVARAYAAVLKAPAKPSFERRWSAWTSGFGGYNESDGDAAAGTHDLTARTYGGAAGLDYHFTPDTLVGLAMAGAGSNWDLAQGLGGGHSDDFQVGLYGRTHSGPLYVAAAVAYAYHWMSTDRYALGDHLTADFNAYGYGGRIEAGYRLGSASQAVTPYAAVQAQRFHTPAYSETDVTGGGFGLSYASNDATDTRSELGARLDKQMALAQGTLLRLDARAAWAHDWVSGTSLAATFQALPGASFTVDGATPPADSALVSAGAELRFANNVSLLARFDGDFAGGSQTYAGSGTLRYSW